MSEPIVCPCCNRCACCGMDAAEIYATLDSAVRRILPFSLKRWIAVIAEAPHGTAIDILRTSQAEAHLIRSEFRSILEAKEHSTC